MTEDQEKRAMTEEEVCEMFDNNMDEYLEFDRIVDRRHPRPDICAFLMLHDLVPGTSDMVTAAEHDEIFLNVSPADLIKAGITRAQVIDLIRCGVRWSSECDSLAMFA